MNAQQTAGLLNDYSYAGTLYRLQLPSRPHTLNSTLSQSMSSTLLSDYAVLRVNDYTSLAIVTVIVYDHTLLISKEVEYIWNQPWSWISFLYVLVRYCGSLRVITTALYGSTIVPGPAKICSAINLMGAWGFPFFIAGADLAMILRVYAMYQCSRIILGVLLMLYIPEVILLAVGAGVFTDPKYLSSTTAQLLDVSICVYQQSNISTTWDTSASILLVALNALICVFVIIQFVRESLSMYQVTKHWQPNQYMSLLAREGVLYFIANFVSLLCNLLGILGILPSQGSLAMFMFVISYVPLFALAPRFILSVRELYARDLRGRFPGGGIDTGFGLSLPADIGTVIEFADNRQHEEIGCDGGIPTTGQRVQRVGTSIEHGSISG